MARQFLNGSTSAVAHSEETEPPKKRPVALRDTSSLQPTDQRQVANSSVPSRSKASIQSSSQTQSSLTATTFQIFDDNAAPASAMEGEWKCLGTEKERKKENNGRSLRVKHLMQRFYLRCSIGPVMKWNEVTLPSSNSALLPQSSAPLSIPIFVDEEFCPQVAAKQSNNKGSVKSVPIISGNVSHTSSCLTFLILCRCRYSSTPQACNISSCAKKQNRKTCTSFCPS